MRLCGASLLSQSFRKSINSRITINNLKVKKFELSTLSESNREINGNFNLQFRNYKHSKREIYTKRSQNLNHHSKLRSSSCHGLRGRHSSVNRILTQQRRLFSTDANSNDGKVPPPEDESPQIEDELPTEPKTGLSATAVPEIPEVPLIAINKNPVFPQFIKMVEVSNDLL